MKINWHTEPYKWYSVSDFLTQEELDTVMQYHIDNVAVPETGRNNLRNEFISDEIRGIIEPRMLELANTVRPNEDHSSRRLNIEMDSIQPGWGFCTHTDIEGKYIVFVLHLSEFGNGTRLHETRDGPYVETMPWIPNGGGGFIRSDSSWHSFDTHAQSTTRRTIILNLM